MVEPGVTGWLAAPGSVESLERAIREMLATGAERLQGMGGEAASLVNQRFRSEDAARQLLSRFQSAGED